MATTINAYSVSLGLNASGLVDGSKLARNEVAAVNRALQSVVTPAERVAKQLDALEKAFRDGAISEKTYEEAVSRLNDKLHSTTKTSNQFADSIKATVAGYLSIQGARAAFGTLSGAADRIDDLVNRSKILGESVPNLQKFEYAAAQLANLDAGSADAMLTKLSRSVGEAASGTAAMQANFQKLGLDFNKLAATSPVEQFMAVAEAISSIENPTLQIAAATDIFGKSGAELIPILTAGKTAIEELMSQTVTIDPIDAEAVANANDALDAMSHSIDGLTNQIVAKLAPSVIYLVDQFTGAKDAISPIATGIGALADGMALAYALGAQVRQTIIDISLAMGAIASYKMPDIKALTGFTEIEKVLDTFDSIKRDAAAATARQSPAPIVEAAKEETAIKLAEAEKYVDAFAEMERESNRRTQAANMQASRALFAEQERRATEIQKRLSMRFDGPKSLEQGSAEAYSFIVGGRNEALQQQLQVAEATRELTKELTTIQNKALGFLKTLTDVSPRRAR